jgi:hypothetical protein
MFLYNFLHVNSIKAYTNLFSIYFMKFLYMLCIINSRCIFQIKWLRNQDGTRTINIYSIEYYCL